MFGCSRIMYVSSSQEMSVGDAYQDNFDSYDVRPVINLKAEVTISSGDGTTSNPYIVS